MSLDKSSTEKIDVLAIYLEGLGEKLPFADRKEFLDEIQLRRIIYKYVADLGELICVRKLELKNDSKYSMSNLVDELHQLLRDTINHMQFDHPATAVITVEREHFNQRMVCTVYSRKEVC